MNMTKHYDNYRKKIDKDTPIAIGKEHTNTGAKGKARFICSYCRYPLVKISDEEYYCNTDAVSFFPQQDDMRTANRISMPRTPEENIPLVAHGLDPNEQYFNKDKVEPQSGLKALSDSQ